MTLHQIVNRLHLLVGKELGAHPIGTHLPPDRFRRPQHVPGEHHQRLDASAAERGQRVGRLLADLVGDAEDA
jgi:hypothetical protein